MMPKFEPKRCFFTKMSSCEKTHSSAERSEVEDDVVIVVVVGVAGRELVGATLAVGIETG